MSEGREFWRRVEDASAIKALYYIAAMVVVGVGLLALGLIVNLLKGLF